MARAVWAACGVGLAGMATALAMPSRAAPVAVPVGLICHAKPPVLSHAFAAAIDVVPAGSVVRVAEAGLSNTDHAELMVKLGLLQGHLMIGRALIEAGQPGLALPHFGHPVRELYDDLKPAIARRGVSPFDGELVSLEAMAAGSPQSPALATQYAQILRILDALRATVPSALRADERFVLGVLGEIAGQGGEDYAESIEGGEVTKPVEYHDTRGYLMYADTVLADMRDTGKVGQARAKIREMQAIVSPIVPPKKPIGSPEEYKALVEQYTKVIAASGA